ncbi:MAG: type II secretion system protein [Planctomycetota bacterium]|jgi:hypothetical protein
MRKLVPRGHSFVLIVIAIVLVVFVYFLYLLLMTPHVRWDPKLKQRAQLKGIDTAIELFNSDFAVYPPSDAMDEAGENYCGAMKLSEAVMGRDLLGYHPKSVFRSDGTDGEGKVLYPNASLLSPDEYRANLAARKGPYLPLVNANAYSLEDLYGEGNTGPFGSGHFVLCDVFKQVKHQTIGKNVGMPILYYKADTSKTAHDVNDPNNPENIYNYRDNHALLALGVPGKPGVKHPMYEDPKIFYEITRNERNLAKSMPHRADTFILLSAGPDGLYGTPDDIANFEWKWRRE